MLLSIVASLLVAGPAHATPPVPDRPNVTSAGFLIAPGTLEMEAGALWMEGFRAPTRLKYAVGEVFEPRFYLDMAGIDGGDPDMHVEGKFRIVRESDIGLAVMAVTALPSYEGDRWDGRVMALATGTMKALEISFNAGIALEGRSGDAVGLAGVPLALTLGGPITPGLALFGETATVVDGGFHDWIFDAGLRLRLTSILLADIGGGWSQEYASPFGQLGMTMNLGRLGG